MIVSLTCGLPTQDFHISLGFSKHDVHGKSKGIGSLVTGAPSAVSVPQLTTEATRLLEVGNEYLSTWSLLPVHFFTDNAPQKH